MAPRLGTRLMPLALWLFSLYLVPALAAFVPFSNCLQSSITKSSPRLLQFVPLNVSAFFDESHPTHKLNVTIYGNVTGQATAGAYPNATDPSWTDPNSTFGKILNQPPGAGKVTTLFSSFNFLTYTPYTGPNEQFCNETSEPCPLAPSFGANSTDLTQLTSYSVDNNMNGAYAMGEIVVNTKIASGYEPITYYGCVDAYVTPDLGRTLRDLLRYLPLAVLAIVGFATITAAIFSPWGTWDIFRWTSNFGRDQDVLRLITPGFADCLQYLQFIVLTGSLSLNYPGFFQPIVSRVGWSALMFNESFVSHGNGFHPIQDGIYVYRPGSTYGMDRMTQVIGMSSPTDAWADMMVWLVVIIVAAIALTQLCFALRWIYRQAFHVPPEDFRSKNWYFSVGNTVRVAVGYFLLPLIAISMFQFSIARQGPIYSIILAAVVILALIIFCFRLVTLFARTRPRSFLFDDLQTVLAYGPLYNTYNDDAATFALIPILVNFLRGIAIGAVQASGLAQIVILAVSEIIFALAINAFRPYPAATSMNLYHTCFSVLRIVTVLLMVAFIPVLDVGGGARGWVGYAILLIHACVLAFGFFLNAVQTLIEVTARLAGAGGSSGGGVVARGGLVKVFGVRQLSKRVPRGGADSRNSMASTAMLNAQRGDSPALLARPRTRSMSASSQLLLESAARSPHRDSQLFANTSDGQTTPDAASTFSRQWARRSGHASPSGIVGISNPPVEAKDPYYRPPRRNTMDLLRSNEGPGAAADLLAAESSHRLAADNQVPRDGAATPLRAEDFEDGHELAKTKTDYAVREVDFYYGVRGPALSSGTRKLKTGPADPTGPVSSATGWFKGLLAGRKRENSKGFEVVRSARAPPPGLLPAAEIEDEMPGGSGGGGGRGGQLYRDDPEAGDVARGRSRPRKTLDDFQEPVQISSAKPPSLPLIDTVGAIELPSRVGSEYSKKGKSVPTPVVIAPSESIPEVPAVPRKSSRRHSSIEAIEAESRRKALLPPSHRHREDSSSPRRIPFGNVSPEAAADHRYSAVSSLHEDEDQENIPPPTDHSREIRPVSLSSTEGRPNSLGFVKEHRASDGLRQQAAAAAAAVESQSAAVQGRLSNTTPPPLPPSRDSWVSEVRSGSPINPYGQPGERASRFRD